MLSTFHKTPVDWHPRVLHSIREPLHPPDRDLGGLPGDVVIVRQASSSTYR
jgi:hypothetical protein